MLFGKQFSGTTSNNENNNNPNIIKLKTLSKKLLKNCKHRLK